jgi:predicted MPP superfamily phosphohydrolase
MRIVHLSDFHIDESSLENLKTYVIPPLIRDLINYNNETRIDGLFFTGDMVDKGGKNFDDIELAFYTFQVEVIEPIMKALDLPLERFYFVPGNHDIDRSLDSEAIESGLTNILKSPEKVNHFIDSGDIEGIKRILPFKKFEKEFYQEYSGDLEITNFQSAFKIKINDTLVGISCFNSAWRCYDSENDFRKIILGERQVTRARELIQDCEIKIGMVHHPLDELSIFESKQIQSMIIKDYDVLLCGHVHEGSAWSKTDNLGTTAVSIAPSNWSSNVHNKNIDYLNGYGLIDINIDKGNIISHHRKYSHSKEEFVANTDMGNEMGVTTFFLPGKEDRVKTEKAINMIKSITEVHLTAVDQHLISYDTDTNAPKKIDEVFVMPRIVSKETVKFDEETMEESDEILTLHDICESKENLLLVGTKEQGKTILLDRLLIEITNNYTLYNNVPVYIDFEEACGNNVETLISRYLSIGIKELRQDILSETNLVLLVDNVKFDRRYQVTLNKFSKLLESYPNIRMIATCPSQIEGELPIEALDKDIFNKFKTAYFENFKTKEIRELMNKWFSQNEKISFDKPEKMESLIKTFRSLNLARTPLAVSMFLWIIEKQENYAPVNNAIMLENFLERLFRKTSDKEIFSGEFNYKNKEKLLADIAYFMYQKNNPNYCVNYQELRDFIYQNLKLKKFDYDEEQLLQHFISKGVMSIEKSGAERLVRFKFSCFFQFYLMKNLDRNKEFKAYVFSEANYLLFMNELDYYSGLKQDDSELLNMVTKRMYDEYTSLIRKISEVQYHFDNPFETLKTIVDRLDSNDIKNITSHEKPTEQDIERMSDKRLSDSGKKDTIVKKDEEISPVDRLARLWIIAAKILKNTEETTVENLKSEAFTKIVKCSMAFVSIYKYMISSHLEESGDTQGVEKKEELSVLENLLPLIHQSVLLQHLGTGKLQVVIKERIDEIILDSSISDLEKFLCIFTYTDLKGKEATKYISQFIKNSKRHYIKDMIFMKLLHYFYYQAKNDLEETIYKNLIGDIITKDDTNNKNRRDFHRKGKIISQIVQSKNKKALNGEDSLEEAK